MKRVIVMRHAKSDWSGTATTDHDRILNKRGRSSATALGNWLREIDVIPDTVLCSSAMRTRETFVRLGLPDAELDITTTRDLYLASEDQILSALQRAKGACVLIVGHNPGIGMFAANILGTAYPHPQFPLYPTGATLVADFDISTWADATWRKAIARHFTVPRDL